MWFGPVLSGLGATPVYPWFSLWYGWGSLCNWIYCQRIKQYEARGVLCEDLKSEWLKRVCTPLSLTLSQSSHSEQHSLPRLPSELHTVLTATVSKEVSHVECIVRHAFNDKTFQDSFNLSFSLFAILFFPFTHLQRISIKPDINYWDYYLLARVGSIKKILSNMNHEPSYLPTMGFPVMQQKIIKV